MCLLKRISLSISDLNTLFPFHFSYFHFSCFRFSCFSGDTAGANKARSRIGEKIEKVAEKIEKTGGTLLDPVLGAENLASTPSSTISLVKKEKQENKVGCKTLRYLCLEASCICTVLIFSSFISLNLFSLYSFYLI